MKFCSYCGAQLPDSAAFCTQCGASTQPGGWQPQPEKTTSRGLLFLAALFPVFGLIAWARYAKNDPERARAYQNAALIGVGVWVALVLCMLVISIALNRPSQANVVDRLHPRMTA